MDSFITNRPPANDLSDTDEMEMFSGSDSENEGTGLLNIINTRIDQPSDTDLPIQIATPSAASYRSDGVSGGTSIINHHSEEDSTYSDGSCHTHVGSRNRGQPVEGNIPVPQFVNPNNNEDTANLERNDLPAEDVMEAPSEVAISSNITPQRSMTKISSTPKSKSTKKIPKASPLKDDDEGQTCSICFEPWGISGEHRLSALKCGHIFGKGCIERWLKAQGSNSRCPQCNSKAHKKDIRVLFVKSLKALDTTEKDKLSNELLKVKAEKSVLEKEYAQTLIKCELNSQMVKKLQDELKMLKASVTRKDVEVDSPVFNKGTASSKPFKLAHYITIPVNKDGECRVMAMNEWMQMLVVSVPSPVAMFPGYGIKKINILNMKAEHYVPLHQKQIRDIAFNPHKQNLLLSVSIDKYVRITNVESNATVQSYETNSQLWCCCWNTEKTNEFFAGSSTGKVLHFDTANTDGPKHTYDIEGSGPLVSLAYVSKCENLQFFKNGLLVSRLSKIFFVEFLDSDFKVYELPIEGSFIHVSHDSSSNHFLVTSRPSQRFPHARHTLYQLVCVNISDCPTTVNNVVTSNEIYSFQGGTTITVLSRSNKIVRSPCQNEYVLVCEESSSFSKLYDIASSSLIQKIYLNDKVLDTVTIHTSHSSFLAFLTSKGVSFYQWIAQL